MPERTRVLHLIERRTRRGAELFAEALASFLNGCAFTNVVCALYEADENQVPVCESLQVLSLGARQRGLLGKTGLQPSVLVRLARKVRELQPAVVVAHGGDTLKYAALSKSWCSMPLMVYRNISMASFWANSPLKAWANRKFLGRFDAVVSVGMATREDFLRLYRLAPETVYAIPNAVDSTPYESVGVLAESKQVRRSLGLSEGDTLLVSVGSLTPEKNQRDLLRLMSELRTQSVHLCLVGDGPLRQELEQYACELQIRERVHFLGFRDDVPELLLAADVFVLPSWSEGMPAALIEAGLAGLPSVAYDVGGVREIVESGVTGMVVPSLGNGEFAQAVRWLLERPEERLKLGRSARDRCRERFSMDRVAADYEGLFSTLLKAKHDHSRG